MAAKRSRSRRRAGRSRKPALGLWATFVIVLLLAGYLFALARSRPDVAGDRLRIDTFFTLAREGRVDEARILDQDAFVVGTYQSDGGSVREYNTPYLREGNSRERLIEILLDNGVATTIDQQFSKRLLQPLTLLVPALIIVVVFVYMILSYNRGTGLFAVRSGARRIDSGGPLARFDDVAGQDAAVTELREVRDFLADPERFASLGAVVPKGILLFGPPGCGKTLLARAVAGEAGAAFYSISGADFVELYVGVGAARVRDLFREAREHAPAILFIDEIDSVGRRRGSGGPGGGGSAAEQEQALNQILTEMDGFSTSEGIIVIGATNRPDILDPALLRPGRFDRSIGLERPDEDGRLAILSLHAKGKPLEPAVDLGAVAHRAVGLNGADLASVMNEAALLAARAGEHVIGARQIDDALRRILDAPERQRRLSMRDRTFGRTTGSAERVTFDDVAGIEEALTELTEVKQYLAEPDRYMALGARPPRGFLLVGPPGCGKTLLARAMATEANAAFFSVAATEFVEIFSGEGAGRVRDLFSEARAVAPSLVFLDEIDAVGARRGASVDSGREREQTLNQILIELDGFSPRSGVIVMAASNRPEILDPALVRPGRFDRTITIGLPDLRGRRAILAVHAKNKRLDEGVDLDAVAAITQGLSGADLANVMNEAALLAARNGFDRVPMTLFEEAVERASVGVARGHRLTDEERRIVAYHEAGHALVGLALPGAVSSRKVSVVSRGPALGANWAGGEEEAVLFSKSMLLDRMAGFLGGRAAEELVFGEPVSGAAHDLARVDELARKMVCELGMGDGMPNRVVPPEAIAAVDAEVGRLVEDAYGRARAVLDARRNELDAVAQRLVAQETLTADELAAVVARDAASRPAARSAPSRPDRPAP